MSPMHAMGSSLASSAWTMMAVIAVGFVATVAMVAATDETTGVRRRWW
jgi:hypothetical protein